MPVDPHGNIRRVSVPQRSPGRLVAQRPTAPVTVPGQSCPATRSYDADPPGADLGAPPPGGHAAGPPVTPARDRGTADTAGPHAVELAGLLHELSGRILSADTMAQALDRLAAFAAGALPGTLRCSVALIGENAPLALAASGPAARAFDDLQYGIGQGPGLDAARSRAMVISQDLIADARWPALTEVARAENIRAVAAIPLEVYRASVGSLSSYVDRPNGIGPDLLLPAMALVNQAEVLLGELRRREILAEGPTVDRAVGVIIAQRGCGVREAYDVLEGTSHRLGLDRHAVAERLIAAAARNAEV